MNSRSENSGIAIVCDSTGAIARFVRDDLELANSYTGGHFTKLFKLTSQPQAEVFLDTIRERGAAFGWELKLALELSPGTLQFNGATTHDQLLICGCVCQPVPERPAAADLDTNLSGKSPEQFELSLYDEISGLNNELVNTQRELHKKAEFLKRMNDEKNHALGIVAHDLRNPISLFHMYSHYLLDVAGARLNDEEREFLRTMHQTAESMTRLVNDVLNAAAIESGRLRLDVVPFDAGDFLRRVADRMRPIARKVGVNLHLDVPDNPTLPLQGDVAKLEQVLCNLIDNAVKFSPAGETVHVCAITGEQQLAISVADRGAGIDAELIDRLFRPFVVGQQRTLHGESSTGLGLSIAKRIVDGHGGSIDVQSVPGSGTRFTISLPNASSRRDLMVEGMIT